MKKLIGAQSSSFGRSVKITIGKKVLSFLGIVAIAYNVSAQTSVSVQGPVPSYASMSDYQAELGKPAANYFEIKERMDSIVANYGAVDYSLKQYYRYDQFWESRVGSEANAPGGFSDYVSAMNNWNANTPICENDGSGVNWQNIGADNITDDNGVGRLANGLVSAIYMKPSNTDIILAGTSASGIWRTTDHGVNWSCVTDHLRYPGLGITHISVSPTNPNFMIAATGKRPYSNQYGIGLLFSNDGGATWQRNSGFPYADYPMVFKTHFDPSDASRIYAMTRTQIFESNNSGTSWSVVFDLNDTINSNYNINTSFSQWLNDIYVNQNGKVFLGGASSAETQLWIRNSGSTSWQNSTAINSLYPTNAVRNYNFTDVHYGDENTFFIGAYLDTLNDFPIYKTTNGGSSFTYFNIGMFNSGDIADKGRDKLAFSRSINADRVYNGVCGIGVTLANTDGSLHANAGCGTIDSDFHVDMRASQVLQDALGNEFLIIGNDGGVTAYDITNQTIGHLSEDGLNGNGLTINQMYSISISQFGTKAMITGNLDNNSFRYDFNTQSWTQFSGGDGHETWYASDGSRYCNLNSETLHKSGLNGITTSSIVSDAGWSLNMALEIDEKMDVLYFGKKGAHADSVSPILVKEDNGVFTNLTIPILTEGMGRIAEIEYDESNPDIVYFSGGNHSKGTSGAGVNNNKLMKSIDGAQSYINLSTSTVYNASGGNPRLLRQVLSYRMISAMKLNPGNSDELWVGISSVAKDSWNEHEKYRCLHSTDGGQTWYDYSENLPPFPLNDLEFVKGSNKQLIAATDVGVFERDATDAEWKCFQGNMPIALVTDIAVDYCDSKIYLSTFGRGVFRTDLNFMRYTSSDYAEMVIKSGVTQRIEETYNCASSIVVEGGGKLEVSGTLYMNKDTRIVVKPGGKLIIDGGIITNACGELWKGIEAWGDSSASQLITNQGFVQLKDGALIEHAHNAVVLWKPGNWGTTGGIIKASNSTFLNNRRDVDFRTYHQYNSSGNEMPNHSHFHNMTFTWDNDFRHTYPLNHVALYNVFGITFAGCTFADERTNPTSEWLVNGNDFMCGIRAIDANFRVIAQCNNVNGCSGPLSSAGWNPSRFTNLDFGIYAGNSANCYSVKIDHSIFSNNLIGVRLVAMDEPSITNNEFEMTPVNNAFTNTNQYGLSLIRTQGIEVQENTFSSGIDYNTNSGSTYGIVCEDLGENDERIRRNNFSNLYFGIYTRLKNRSGTSGVKGLSFFCNTNAENKYDHFITDEGIKAQIGSQLIPAGNSFTQIGASNEDFFNLSNNHITYFYKTPPANHEIMEYGSNMTKVYSFGTLDCESEFETCYNCPVSNFPSLALQTEFTAIKGNYATAYFNYELAIDGGNTNGLINTVNGINSQNANQIRQTLLSNSPFVSDEVARVISNKPSSIYPHSWTEELVLANIDLAKSGEFMHFLETKTEPLPPSMIWNIKHALQNSAGTSRTGMEAQISDLSMQKTVLANHFLHHYQFDTVGVDMDSIRYWLEEKDNVLKDLYLTDTYMRESDYNAVGGKLSQLSNKLNTYDDHLQAEVSDFVDLKQLMIDLKDRGTEYPDITSADKALITNLADNGSGLAKYQAREILCFFFNECEKYDAPVPTSGNFKTTHLNEENVDFNIYPNPAKDWVTIEFFKKYEEVEIRITDIGGKLIFETKTSDEVYKINTQELSNGVYFIQMVDTQKGDKIGQQKMVVQK